jgi:predicted nuclease of predicted toxin-antitoxin system
VRILLHANLSPRRIGNPLRQRGHDVHTVADDADLEGVADESLLELATQEERILVTRNSRDFAPICRTWAGAGREHGGVILIWTLSHRQFRELVAGIESWLDEIDDQSAWRGIVVSI